MTSQRRGSRVVVTGRPSREFVCVPYGLIRDGSVGPGAARLILWLASQAPGQTVYKSKAAKDLDVKADTVRDWIDQAAESRYLYAEPTGERDSRGHLTYVYHVDLSGGFPGIDSAGNTRKSGLGNTRKSGHKERALRKVVKDSPPTRSEVSDPERIDPDWQANATSRSVAASLLVDLEQAERLFKEGALLSGERRRDWDKTFTAYVNAVADDRADVDFPWVADPTDETAPAVEAGDGG